MAVRDADALRLAAIGGAHVDARRRRHRRPRRRGPRSTRPWPPGRHDRGDVGSAGWSGSRSTPRSTRSPRSRRCSPGGSIGRRCWPPCRVARPSTRSGPPDTSACRRTSWPSSGATRARGSRPSSTPAASTTGSCGSRARRGPASRSWTAQTGDLTEFYEAGIALPEDRWPSVETALSKALDDRGRRRPSSCWRDRCRRARRSMPTGASPRSAVTPAPASSSTSAARRWRRRSTPDPGSSRSTRPRLGDHRHRDGRPGRCPCGRTGSARSRRGRRADHDGHRRGIAPDLGRRVGGRAATGARRRTAWAVATPFSAGWSWRSPEAPTCPRPSATARRPRPRTRSCPARVSWIPRMSTVSCLDASLTRR